MIFKELKNEIYDWGCYDFWEQRYKTFWELIDVYLDDGYEFTLIDDGYELNDCDYYINVCNCAIKRYPNKEIFKNHLDSFNLLKEKYKEKNK